MGGWRIHYPACHFLLPFRRFPTGAVHLFPVLMAYMKVNKAIALFIALAFIALYATSNLGVLMKHIEEARARMAPAWWPERVRYGDLYSFSNLAEFKSEVGLDRNALHPNPLSTLPRDIDLYAICDS